MSMAMQGGPRELEPFHEAPRGFSFPRDVQPILDRRCVACHRGEGTDAPDLRDTPVHDPVSKRMWSASYLALTNSELTGNGASGRPNELVNWISAQSVPPMLPPYHAGAGRSGLLPLLRSDHHDAALTTRELEVIACWIDLLVPFCGDYAEAAAWSEDEHAKYARFLEKRRLSDEQERANVAELARERRDDPSEK